MSDPTSPPPKGPTPPLNGPQPSSPRPPLVRPNIRLPGLGRPFSEFADDVGRELSKYIADKVVDQTKGKANALERPPDPGDPPDPSNPDHCFLCIRHGIVGRVRRRDGSGRQASGLYFEPLDNEQAVTELERWITFVNTDKTGDHPNSMYPGTAKTLLAAPVFRDYLQTVDRIFDFAIPVGFRGELPQVEEPKADLPGTLEVEEPQSPDSGGGTSDSAPAKVKLVLMRPGFGNYRQKNGERVFYYCDKALKHFVDIEEAQKTIKAVFQECVFSDEQSKAHAIARLLTPYCQALMGWRKRSPLWVFAANKPRAGKDYLAMVTPLVHACYPIQDPPLECDDEVKRRITAALMSGR